MTIQQWPVFENYPAVEVRPVPPPSIAGGAGRGCLAGMASAALTFLASIPTDSPSSNGLELVAIVLPALYFSFFASVVGIVPGLALGALLAQLARNSVSTSILRLIAALIGPAVSLLVTVPLQFTSFGGLLVAAMSGAIFAVWVAGPGPGGRAVVRP